MLLTAVSQTAESQGELALQQVINNRRAIRLFKIKQTKEQEIVSL